jgi:hypothetical protein
MSAYEISINLQQGYKFLLAIQYSSRQVWQFLMMAE